MKTKTESHRAVHDDAILARYVRLRSIEERLSEPIHAALTDDALTFVAEGLGMDERGERLREHDDFAILSELAMYHHALNGKALVERFYESEMPEAGTDRFVVLQAMMNSRVTLLHLREPVRGVGVHVDDMLMGGRLFLADIGLSLRKKGDGPVILARLLEFDEFVMIPCTAFLEFDAALALTVVAGLKREAGVPLAQRYATSSAKTELAFDLTEMALSDAEEVSEALEERFCEEEEPS